MCRREIKVLGRNWKRRRKIEYQRGIQATKKIEMDSGRRKRDWAREWDHGKETRNEREKMRSSILERVRERTGKMGKFRQRWRLRNRENAEIN